MERLDTPVNLFFVHITPELLRLMKPITTLDSFVGGTREFHPDGLFSTEIFGRLGTPERDTKFSYINLGTTIFHPFVYKALCSLAALYKGILEGTTYAIFDEETKDFVKADPISGQTGFQFFFSKWREIQPKKTGSLEREAKLQYIKHYDVIETRQVLVLPAGKRDIEFDDNSRPIDHEINDLYRKVLQTANTFPSGNNNLDQVFNKTRLSLQQSFNEIYEHFNTLVAKGKKSFIQAKWARRALDYGMRNVISAPFISSPLLGDPSNVSANNTLSGLFPTIAATMPKVQFEITSQWLAYTFPTDGNRALLVNPQSLRQEEKSIESKTFDKWRTTEGLEKLFRGFANKSVRNKPIMVEGYYLALIYRDHECVKVFGGLDDLPENFDKENVKPITYSEFYYYFCSEMWDDTPMFVTRYPIAGEGSVYPSLIYCTTTSPSFKLRRLNDAWEINEDSYIYKQFPSLGDVSWIETMSPAQRMMGGLGADFDGDQCSGNAIFSSEAKEEIKKFFDKVETYIGPGGKLRNSPFTETVERVFYALSGI